MSICNPQVSAFSAGVKVDEMPQRRASVVVKIGTVAPVSMTNGPITPFINASILGSVLIWIQ
jgi:hypothetical protein